MTGAGPLIYLHGLPGSSMEISLAGCSLDGVFAPEFGQGKEEASILAHIGERKARLVGFSLGAFRALVFAAQHPQAVESIDLIAPAAPLDLGDYLPLMAGGPVFRLARLSPTIFTLISGVQAYLARHRPQLLARQIFSTAQGHDAALVKQPDFQQRWAAMVQASLGAQRHAYCQAILAYVRAPHDFLSQVHAPVTLWYGTQDNWTPPAMAMALAARLPYGVACHAIEGASHYSTLCAALPQIIKAQRNSD